MHLCDCTPLKYLSRKFERNPVPSKFLFNTSTSFEATCFPFIYYLWHSPSQSVVESVKQEQENIFQSRCLPIYSKLCLPNEFWNLQGYVIKIAIDMFFRQFYCRVVWEIFPSSRHKNYWPQFTKELSGLCVLQKGIIRINKCRVV